MPPSFGWSGCGSGGYGKMPRCLISSGESLARLSHEIPFGSLAVGPTGTGFPPDMRTVGSVRPERSYRCSSSSFAAFMMRGLASAFRFVVARNSADAAAGGWSLPAADAPHDPPARARITVDITATRAERALHRFLRLTAGRPSVESLALENYSPSCTKKSSALRTRSTHPHDLHAHDVGDEAFQPAGRWDRIELVVVQVDDLLALRADEMVMPVHVGVVALALADHRHLLDHPEAGQCIEHFVDRGERQGGHLGAHPAVELLGARMVLRFEKRPVDRHPL